MEKSREAVAEWIGASPAELSFSRSASEASSIIAAGLTLQKGDHVLFDSHAHPGGSFPWLSYQKRFGIVVQIFEPDPNSIDENLKRIADLITPKTKVIQIDHITAPTGILMPIQQIASLAHQHNIWLHVDGAQSVGMLPLNMQDLGCDSFATSCHKWMGAPHGTGFLWIKKERIPEVWPPEVGAYCESYFKLPDQFELRSDSLRFEYGTRDTASVASLRSCITFLNTIGMENVFRRGKFLADYLKTRLQQIEGVTVLSPTTTSQLKCAITTFKTSTVPYDELYSFLLSNYNVRCRIVTEQNLNALRVSTHIFNFPSDCDKVVEGTIAAIQQRINITIVNEDNNNSILV